MPRNSASFSTVLKLYRAIAAASLICLGLALVLTIVAFVTAGPRDLLTEPAPVLAVLALLLALVATRYGHVVLHRTLSRADLDRNAVLASANRDALTGTFSRSYFLDLVKESVFHGSSSPVVYMQIDMDNLKALNDGDGHAAGDAALVHLIDTIRRLAPDATIGRLGGDEFGIAFIGEASKSALKRLGAQILSDLGQPTEISSRRTSLSATIGIAAFPQDANHIDELISKADLALYRGKRNGRNQVVLFDADMMADERHKRFVERELRAAMLMNELELFYQPIYGADAVTIRSYEALVRWNHTVRGMIPPCDFVPIAEQSDLIDMLGEWVLRRACLDQGALGAPVSVNVSSNQLRRSEFAERFAAIVAAAGVAGERLIVEITETVPLNAGMVERANIDALRAMGIRIAIDDFGAGHASLQYLRGLPFDILKIDRTYVANLETRQVDGVIIAAICTVARAIGVDVVAEGVETDAQLTALKAAGCTGFQGYLLGRPAPLREILRRQAPLTHAA
jgi:diguanylate cyclase (GGDEF)-like protein